ncbi:MAG: DpnD/PcfM family protein [Bacilli bacterium]|nr:DpnD/PcfM family protein [Bacilli bacterium]
MKKYDIEIEETLRRVVSVEAENIHDAIDKVDEKYHNEEIVLDSSDFVESSINNLYSKKLDKPLNMYIHYNPSDEKLTILCDDKSEEYICENVRDLNRCVNTFSTDFLENSEISHDEEELERDI